MVGGIAMHTASGKASRLTAPKDVFVFAGQSNMAGADSVIPNPPGFVSTEADRRTLFTGAPVLEGSRSPDYCPWGEMRGHRATNPRYGEAPVHGPEVGFARRLHEKGVRDIAIVASWANFGRDATEWPWRDGGELHRPWLAFVDARLAELRDRGFTPRVRGFVWHQGIDDAIHGKLAPHYEAHLTALIAALRRRFDAPEAPFVLARSVNSPIARRITGAGADDPMAVVRRAQVAVGEQGVRTAWVDVDDLPNVVQHHFSAASQLVIGRRFGDAYLKFAER